MIKLVKVALRYHSTKPAAQFRAVCRDAVTGRLLGYKILTPGPFRVHPAITIGDLAEMIGDRREPYVVRVDIYPESVGETFMGNSGALPMPQPEIMIASQAVRSA